MSDEPTTTDGGVTDPEAGAETDAPEPEPEEAPAVPRGWSERRRGMDPEIRRHVMDACAVRTSSGWMRDRTTRPALRPNGRPTMPS